MTPIEVLDINGNKIRAGDRVMFNLKGCVGYGSMGTVSEIVRTTTYNKATEKYDLPWGDEYQYTLGVIFDDTKKWMGECIDLRKGSNTYIFVERQMPLIEEVTA